ncbi:hypothetical protein MUK42_30584 [Musa troglodytarum]|uniref:Non-specific lipid-transfer protein n=1 Tax=Musa troglodytarum TaxID=320322 RepID=A0A9E7FRS0_9LILI|nr:hypothetical protein MUK42_30584 [Musa troglodytarum]
MARSGALLPLALALLLLLVTAPRVTPAITCGQVTSALRPCIAYATNKGALTSGCCNGVKNLNSASKTSADRKAACNCIKSLIARVPVSITASSPASRASVASASPTPSAPPPTAPNVVAIRIQLDAIAVGTIPALHCQKL